MTELTPCPACQRHVEVGELSCPFCSTTLRAASAQHIALGRVSRAAMFSAALVACSGSKPEPVKPPMLDLAGTGTSAADAGVPDAPVVADAAIAQAPADAAAGPRPPNPDRQPDYERRPPNKPYGAPPARKRIV